MTGLMLKTDDLSVDGEVLTGVAALDWKQDQWLIGPGALHQPGGWRVFGTGYCRG